MSDRTWKRMEREVAHILGGKRWLSEKGSNAPDIKHPHLSPEVKYRQKLPLRQEVRDWIAQAERNALPNKPWVVVMKERGMPTKDSYVVMRLEDFARFAALNTVFEQLIGDE